MPVRKVLAHGRNIIGLFPSLKLKRMVAYESLVERDTYYCLDYDPAVSWFEEQPRVIPYRFGGKLHRYTPDVWLVRRGENVYLECKPEQFVDSPDNQVIFAAARAWCTENGARFEVVVAETLRAGFRLKNIKLMTLYARHSVPASFRAEVVGCLAAGPMSMHQLGARLACNETPVYAWLLCLGFHHIVDIPVDDEPVTEDTVVSAGGVA